MKSRSVDWVPAARVKDNRFIAARNYVDDIVLPGMLHMEIFAARLRTLGQVN